MKAYFEERSEGISKSRLRLGLSRDRSHRFYGIETDFKCVHCRVQISTDPILAGVKNRNHCPYCLWSRHLDWFEPGDRLSPCKAPMQPVGLTMKRANKRYNRFGQGELMLIHLCVDCGKLSINRIAADDDVQALVEVLDRSPDYEILLGSRLREEGIQPLCPRDRSTVAGQLLGTQSLSLSASIDPV